jgi:hypothetical protein
MAGAVQWGVDQLYAMLNQIVAGAQSERAQISMNNQHLIDLNATVQALPASAQKSAMLSWIQSSVSRQAMIAASYRNLSANFARLAAQVESWLTSVGITPSVPQLSGLGIAPAVILVPIALAALAATAWAAVAWIHQQNAAQIAAINAHNQALAALVSRGATVADIQAFERTSAAEVAAAAPRGADPFGQIQGILGLAIVGGALFLFAPLLKGLSPKRGTAA